MHFYIPDYYVFLYSRCISIIDGFQGKNREAPGSDSDKRAGNNRGLFVNETEPELDFSALSTMETAREIVELIVVRCQWNLWKS
jgi:hypothetical protein